MINALNLLDRGKKTVIIIMIVDNMVRYENPL